MLGNFLCRNVLLIWIKVGHGATVLAVGAVVRYFTLSLSLSLSLSQGWSGCEGAE